MKNVKFTILAIACSLFSILTSCSGGTESSQADNKLGKIEIEIPAALKNKPEAVEYIKGMTEVADGYALMIDNVFEEYGEYIGVPEEELGMMDKIKLVKATADVAVKYTELMGKWAQYQEKRNALNEQLSEEELKALENVWHRFEKRMEQIEAKHHEYFAQGKEADQKAG